MNIRIMIAVGLMNVALNGSLFCASEVQLKKIFHHKAHNSSSTEPMGKIEVASVVFYFSQDPKIEVNRAVQGNKERVTFFIPDVVAQDTQARAMLSNFKEMKDHLYTVRMRSVEAPRKGLELLIEYNPETLVYRYDHFDAITRDKAVIVRLYDKAMLNKIKHKQMNVLVTAENTKMPHVIIDCGHGGADMGAIGCNGAKEKDITLAVGKNVSELLLKQGYKVSMTRDCDISVALDERTSKANACNANLFISLHANSGPRSRAQGLETFYADPTMFTSGACLETSLDILVTPLRSDIHEKSKKLAHQVHNNVIKQVRAHQKTVEDRKVKTALSQVLVGTTMPAILVELGFVTHESEVALLCDASYQDALAQGVCQGVASYWSSITKKS